MTATMLLVGLSPFVVALIRQPQTAKPLVVLLSFAIVVVLFTLGRFLDGGLTWPLGEQFFIELGAAWAGQQGIYKLVLAGSDQLEQLEWFGTVRG